MKCYHCDLGLRNWETTDLPWIEHARGNGKCNYVLLVKGQDFVNKSRSVTAHTDTNTIKGVVLEIIEKNFRKCKSVETKRANTNTLVPETVASSSFDLLNPSSVARICKVCMNSEISVVFLPCRHMITCKLCAANLSKCPICRFDIYFALTPIVC